MASVEIKQVESNVKKCKITRAERVMENEAVT